MKEARKFKMSYKGLEIDVLFGDHLYTKANIGYKKESIIDDLDDMIDDEGLDYAIAQGFLAEIKAEGTVELPEAVKGITPWKSRYYLKSGYLGKANAFYSPKKDSGKYEWKVNGGYVYAEKTYNGAVVEEIIADFGEIKE